MSASADEAKSTTNQTFLSALILNSAVCGAQVVGFILIKRYFRKVYQPRSYLPLPDKRSDELAPGLFSWIPQVCFADSQQIMIKNGLDAYCFIRFLRLITLIFAPAFIISWAVLLPVYGANPASTKSGLDKFTFGNIPPSTQIRLIAPLFFAYAFTFYVLYLLKTELQNFIVTRQNFITSKAYRAQARSRTVLLTGIPADLMTVDSLKTISFNLPHGGAEHIWMVRDTQDLPDVYDDLKVAFNKLESGVTSLITTVHKAKSKQESSKSKGKIQNLNPEEGKTWSKYITKDQRPHHRLGLLGLIGQKVDTIEWSTQKIADQSKALNRSREHPEQYQPQNAAFIQFHSQIAAHMFAQSLSHHQPMAMTGKWTDCSVSDVIWSTLGVKPLEQRIRGLISWAITIALIVFWSIPVAFVGVISNVNGLCKDVSWMAWLCKLPAPIPGILQGVLPPVMLAVLFMLLPIVLRLLAVFQAIPLRSLVELSLMSRYFLFLVIHGFLIVTLSSGLVASIPAITNNPSSAVTILAQELPKASTFFLTYIVATTLAGAASALIQISSVVIYKLKLQWLASTPRSVYQTRFQMSSVAWGTIFPNITLLAVIGLSYVTVSPILNGFVLVGFALLWFVYKYLFIYVMDLSSISETGGKFYPMAIKQMFVGLYIGEIFLAALFFFSQDSQERQSGVVEGAFMVALIVITILCEIVIRREYFPLVDYLPISLAKVSEHQEKRVEDKPKMDGQTFESNSEEGTSIPHNAEEDRFDHPALWKPIGIVWIPHDQLEVSTEAANELNSMEIKATQDGARFDDAEKRVFVNRNPPDDPSGPIDIPEQD